LFPINYRQNITTNWLPKSIGNSLGGLLDLVIQNTFSQDALCLSILILIENNLALILDEAALGESPVERAERILKIGEQETDLGTRKDMQSSRSYSRP
jgi:hypothetical protein